MKNYKKGFTLVELLIVIAILAILATVVVVSYVSYIDKANQSVDQQLITQMNNVLQADEILNEKPATVVDAKNILIASRLDDFTPIDEKNVFYWVGTENRVILWSKDEVDGATGRVTYPEEYVKTYADYTEPSSDWADLSLDYTSGEYYVEIIPEEGETVGIALLKAIRNAPDGAVLKLPESAEVNLGMYAYYVASYMKNDSGMGKSLTIDLNGGKLISDTQLVSGGYNYGYYGITIPESGSLTLANGNVDITTDNSAYAALMVASGGHLILRDVELTTNGAGVYPSGDASEVVIDNCTIKAGAYGIGTNAAESSNIRITVTNTTVEATNTFLVNTVSETVIENCQFTASGWGLIVREGHVTVSNSTITTTDGDVGTGSTYSCGYRDFSYTQNSNGAPFWGQGYQMPYAVVTIGDYSNGDSYIGNATLIMNNVNLVSANSSDIPDVVMAAQMEGKNASLTYDGASTVGKIVVFGEDYSRAGVDHTFEHKGTITVNGESKTLD